MVFKSFYLFNLTKTSFSDKGIRTGYEIVKYSKINTLFKREMTGENKGKIMPEELSQSEFGAIDKWLVTEKMDGTNTRLIFTKDKYEVKGRTDNAQFNPKVISQLEDIAKKIKPNVAQMESSEDNTLIIYGETVGELIQGGNFRYGLEKRDDIDFYVFDIAMIRGDKMFWIDDNERIEICKQLGLKQVPYLGIKSTSEIIEFVKKGFKSKIDNKTNAEGVVCRPIVPLYDKYGHRIIFKLKTKDFKSDKEKTKQVK